MNYVIMLIWEVLLYTKSAGAWVKQSGVPTVSNY